MNSDTDGRNVRFCGIRAAALRQFIELSQRWADETEQEARAELAFSAPGEWDYDESTDQLAVVRATRETIKALQLEPDEIVTRDQLPRGAG